MKKITDKMRLDWVEESLKKSCEGYKNPGIGITDEGHTWTSSTGTCWNLREAIDRHITGKP